MNINVTPLFVLAGEAVFTVSNQGGQHFTYRVNLAKPSSRYPGPAYFISVLTGPHDGSDDPYTYVGQVVIPNMDPRQPFDPSIRMTKGSKYTDRALLVVSARWALRVIWQVARGTYTLPPGYSIRHNGKCGRCGRELTHPASLDTGLGPECADLLGVSWVERTDRQPELSGGFETEPAHG